MSFIYPSTFKLMCRSCGRESNFTENDIIPTARDRQTGQHFMKINCPYCGQEHSSQYLGDRLSIVLVKKGNFAK